MNIRHYLCALLCLLSAAGCSDEKTPSLDYTAIDELIAECTQLHDSAEEGEGLGEYVKGSKDIFQKSIDEASYVRTIPTGSPHWTIIAKSWLRHATYSPAARCRPHVRFSTARDT